MNQSCALFLLRVPTKVAPTKKTMGKKTIGNKNSRAANNVFHIRAIFDSGFKPYQGPV